MLYECIECKHKISADAWRCPNCGTKYAGVRAVEQERDRLDPGWREREQKAEDERLKSRDEEIAADQKAKDEELAATNKAYDKKTNQETLFILGCSIIVPILFLILLKSCGH